MTHEKSADRDERYDLLCSKRETTLRFVQLSRVNFEDIEGRLLVKKPNFIVTKSSTLIFPEADVDQLHTALSL